MCSNHNLRGILDTQHWNDTRSRILVNIQKVMGPIKNRADDSPPEVEVLESIDFPNVIRKRVTYLSEPGDHVPAYLTIPKRLKNQVPAILCLHQTTPLGKAETVGLGRKPNLRFAKELSDIGYVTLAPDYPNYGDYKIDPYSQGYESTTMKGIWNHMRAVDLLQSLPEVDPSRIGCIGHSLGGHNTIFIGAFDTRIKAMVSSCGFTTFSKYAKGDLSGWSHSGYMPRISSLYNNNPLRMPFDFTDLISLLAPRAFFTNSPIRERAFDVSGVHDSIQAASEIYKLLRQPDKLVAVHPDVGHDFPYDVRQQAYSFLNSALCR